jgi:outer membrane autotransporter protein
MLTIQNGGTVTNTIGAVANGVGSRGMVTVTGSGSTWDNSGTLQVGAQGAGILVIKQGGTVMSNGGGSVGLNAGSNGVVTVTGAGSAWNNIAPSAGLNIGSFGTGTLTIENGGKVINTSGFAANIGSSTGSQGTVLVTGPGSTWTNNKGLNVGNSGTGTLTVANHGEVTATDVTVASNTGSQGTINIGAPDGQTPVAPGILDPISIKFGSGKGFLVFNHTDVSGTYVFDANISGGPGAVDVLGGTTVFTGDNSYTGVTTIGDGATFVAGVPVGSGSEVSTALGASNVFLIGGTLRTRSFQTGAPLTIHVGGNYNQGPSGTLALGIGGLQGEQFDHVQVDGSASLNGTLAVSSLNNFRPVSGNAFEVIRSNGTRSGEFAQVNDFLNNNPNLQRIDVYAPNGVALVYVAAAPAPTPVPTPPPVPMASPTPNPRPPINVEDPNPLPPVNPEAPLQLPGILAILDPTAVQLTSLFEIPFSGANSQRFNLNDRMTQIRQGSTGFVSAIAPAPPPPPTGKEVESGKNEVVAPFVTSPTNRWGVWVNGWGDWVNVEDDNGVKGYNFTTGGVSVGIDYKITDCLAVGIFGTYAHTWTSLSPGDVDVNTGRGGAYAIYWNQGFYVDTAIYGGYNSYDTSRQTLLQGRFANGSTEGYEFSTFVDTGYEFHLGNLSIGPVFAAQYTNVQVDSFTENGSFLPLNIHSDSEESWRTDLGVLASYTWHIGQIRVIPSLWAAWEHEYKYSNLPITFSSVDFPGASSATVFGPHEGHDSAIINAGVGIQWTPRISTYFGYQGQLGRDNYNANGVTGTFSFSF